MLANSINIICGGRGEGKLVRNCFHQLSVEIAMHGLSEERSLSKGAVFSSMLYGIQTTNTPATIFKLL